MKGAPGKSDMRAVNYLFEQGCSVAEVSSRLGIAETGLLAHAPKDVPTIKKAVKKRVKKKVVTNDLGNSNL